MEDLCAERQRTTACTAVLDKAGVSYLRLPVDPNDGHYDEIDPATGKTYTRIADHVRKNPQLTLSNLIKSMVFEYGEGTPFMVLMNNDLKIDPKKVAALMSQHLGRKISQSKIKMMKEEDAINFTGFQFGGTTAIGIATKMIIFAHDDIQHEEQIFINGGSKTFLVGMSREALEKVVELEYADVAKR
jgi:prolyl-tRNA editing enzyme YbaK/EbsC (Cys-tRNA(Pro) deacylase)